LGPVAYRGSESALLTSISPRVGTVLGGDVLTFTGKGFVSDIAKYRITIDGINCPVSAATSGTVTCKTLKRPGLIPTSLEIFIEGKGLVSNQGLVFRYCSPWSSDTTWGGEFAPLEMESVYIPAGFNLLVDVDKTPQLNAVIVEGSLIFAPDEKNPDHERFFDARYIFVHKGYMEVGTEEFPYTSKITITMHGDISDPYLPIYGNKVIGVREGVLDMHGIKREPAWSVLDTTVEAGGKQITISEKVDWKVGEELAIASTSYNPREGE
jgi:hypothetical protein